MKDYILCCVSRTEINQVFLNEIKDFLKTQDALVGKEENLTESGLFAFDLPLSFPHEFERIKKDLMDLSNKFSIDMALIPHDGFRSQRKLVLFDMDSTLIQHEVIDEMASVHGVGDRVRKITEKAMNGELNFDEALRERVSLLKGLKRSDMEKIFYDLKLTSGVESLIHKLKQHGYKTGIVSGGFKFFAEGFKTKLGMDYAFANELEFEGEVLTGQVKGEIINAEKKALILEELARKEKLTLDQIVAVGDGANDLPMLAKAGFGIAYHAKEKVRRLARHHVGHGDMTTLLYFLGITGKHLNEIV